MVLILSQNTFFTFISSYLAKLPAKAQASIALPVNSEPLSMPQSLFRGALTNRQIQFVLLGTSPLRKSKINLPGQQ